VIISDDPEAVRRLLIGAKTVAVVGASPKPDRDSHQIAKHLIARGYDVVPVNPGATEILGRKCFPDLKSIGRKIDIVNVFRSPEHVPPIADEAIAIKAEALWLQSGITHEAAAKKASDAGLYVIEDRCIATALSTLLRS
jgi:uncharacterized protein